MATRPIFSKEGEIMANNLWQRARTMHKRHHAVKRHMFNAHKRQNSTYYHLEAACKRYMAIQSQVIGNLELDQLDDLQAAYKRFHKAKLNHDEARKELAHALNEFKRYEIRYAILIFKGLRCIGTKMTSIAKVFGFTPSTMSRWVNSDEDEMEEYYDDQYGTGK